MASQPYSDKGRERSGIRLRGDEEAPPGQHKSLQHGNEGEKADGERGKNGDASEDAIGPQIGSGKRQQMAQASLRADKLAEDRADHGDSDTDPSA